MLHLYSMETIAQFLSDFASFVWGLPLLILLMGGGLYLLVRSRFLPFRYLGHAIAVLRGKYDDPNDPGEISHFKALSTALASTVGMGNIAGVAVAIAAGGPGAVFWMWMSAIVGMSTKFFTSSLSIMYRGEDDEGNVQGGPMYFIENGLGKRWKPLAVFFTLCCMVGVLPLFNVNQLTQAINDILLPDLSIASGTQSNIVIGCILIGITAIVILGGLQRISATASKVVPGMVLLYFIIVFAILLVYRSEVPYYFQLIFTDAFRGEYFNGDSVWGGVLGSLILLGVRRGAFSNEAGIGTAPMAHGAAKTDEPIREGLVAMLGPAIDTLVVCTLTALTILVTGVWKTTESNGVTLTANAFDEALPGYGKYLLLLCIFAFSISSLFSYSYYGTKCMSYLFGSKVKHYFNYFYIGSIMIGATTTLDMMINLIDGMFALMAIPTMLATIIMAPKVEREFRAYIKKLK